MIKPTEAGSDFLTGNCTVTVYLEWPHLGRRGFALFNGTQ